MRIILLPVLLLVASTTFAACSTDDDLDGSSTIGPEPYIPPTNCVLMSEADACKALSDAIASSIGELQCPPLTMKACPDYIRSRVVNQEADLLYDEGSITGCAQFYLSYSSCADFDNRPCTIKYYPKDLPTGCPDTDAGQDVASSEDGSQDDGSQDDGSQDDGSQDDGSQDDGSQDDGSQDDSGQGDAEASGD